MQVLRITGVLLVLCLQACTTTTDNRPAEQIVGTWEGTVQGFRVVSTYTVEEVRVDNYPALPYQLEGDRLVIDGDPNSARLVSFPASREMLQRDPLTGTEHRFTRLAP